MDMDGFEDESESEERTRRVDISYPKLLLWCVNDCRIAMTECMSVERKKRAVRAFKSELKSLQSMLYPYLPPELKAYKIDCLDGGSGGKHTNAKFNSATRIFNSFLDVMAENNLLLETTRTEKI